MAYGRDQALRSLTGKRLFLFSPFFVLPLGPVAERTGGEIQALHIEGRDLLFQLVAIRRLVRGSLGGRTARAFAVDHLDVGQYDDIPRTQGGGFDGRTVKLCPGR